jgi:hypothetical protein
VRLIRLNATQRATFEGVEIDGRAFVKLDILQSVDGGAESLTRVLIDAAKIDDLVDALKRSAEENADAELRRTDL